MLKCIETITKKNWKEDVLEHINKIKHVGYETDYRDKFVAMLSKKNFKDEPKIVMLQ